MIMIRIVIRSLLMIQYLVLIEEMVETGVFAIIIIIIIIIIFNILIGKSKLRTEFSIDTTGLFHKDTFKDIDDNNNDNDNTNTNTNKEPLSELAKDLKTYIKLKGMIIIDIIIVIIIIINIIMIKDL